MRKLKRTIDGKVYDCTVILDEATLFVVYYDDVAHWTIEPLDHFVPAVPNVDY